MSLPLCVVFSDAFAYRTYEMLGGLGEGYSLKKIVPGIGYSSNLHYLLFDGKKPDELGFFTDYSWQPAIPGKLSKFHKLCDNIETVNNVYRAFTRKITKENNNIPFSEKKYFRQNGKYKFLTENPISVFGHDVDLAYERNNTDASFAQAEQYVNDGSRGIVVVLEELDHTGHAVGSLGTQYIESAEHILDKTRTLFCSFSEKYENALCVLISDHGMSDVYAGINVYESLKHAFGLPGRRYQVYLDSVYLRLWSDDKDLMDNITAFLKNIDALVLINQNDRNKYGVKDRNFGDAIFRLREGYVFQPNHFGISLRGGCKGIHGFMEPTDSASGILVANREIDDNGCIEAVEVFEKVRSLL